MYLESVVSRKHKLVLLQAEFNLKRTVCLSVCLLSVLSIIVLLLLLFCFVFVCLFLFICGSGLTSLLADAGLCAREDLELVKVNSKLVWACFDYDCVSFVWYSVTWLY